MEYAAGPPCDPALLEEAVALLRAAGERTLRWFRAPDLAVDSKADGSPVTLADRDAEHFVRAELAARFPGDAVAGEEEDDTDGTTGRRWVVDPIDGTKAFTRGVPLYTNLLALDDEHGPVVGVINMPALGETVYAGRGLGCFCNGTPARVSAHGTLDGAYVTASSIRTWPAGAFAALDGAGAHVRTWGDGYGYALVATGRVEAMFDEGVSLWDMAPMPVILAEAGGRFSDLAGVARADSGNGLATNGILHEAVLACFTG
jgi:histidinol phosphatase-like enzyme (inositol monophosphatase family)